MKLYFVDTYSTETGWLQIESFKKNESDPTVGGGTFTDYDEAKDQFDRIVQYYSDFTGRKLIPFDNNQSYGVLWTATDNEMYMTIWLREIEV